MPDSSALTEAILVTVPPHTRSRPSSLPSAIYGDSPAPAFAASSLTPGLVPISRLVQRDVSPGGRYLLRKAGKLGYRRRPGGRRALG